MERETKLVLAYHLGHRTVTDTVAFTEKLDRATRGRFQISTDGWMAYPDAISYSLGTRVDYAQIIKIYENKSESKMSSKALFSDKIIKAIKNEVFGEPNMAMLCTSHIERLNLSVRTQVKRLARLTLSSLKSGITYRRCFPCFSLTTIFCKSHKSLKGCTPAMAHGIEKTFWTVEDLLSY